MNSKSQFSYWFIAWNGIVLNIYQIISSNWGQIVIVYLNTKIFDYILFNVEIGSHLQKWLRLWTGRDSVLRKLYIHGEQQIS